MLRKAFTIGAILTAVVIVAILLSVCVEKGKITLPSSESTEPPKPSIYKEDITQYYVPGDIGIGSISTIFVTVKNDGGPGIVKVELYRGSTKREGEPIETRYIGPELIYFYGPIKTRYIYLDKGEKRHISFKTYQDHPTYYMAKAYPAPVVHIQGKPWQDYVPGLSHIDAKVWVREGGTKNESYWNLWVINSDGSGKKRLISDLKVREYYPGYQELLEKFIKGEKALEVLFWSKDGKKIFFLQEGDIWVMDSSGKNKKKLTDNMDCREAYLSPKGDKIAFMAKPHGVYFVYTMNSDGTNLKQLLKHRSRLAWSPDGERIAFTRRNLSGSIDSLYIVNADGSGEKLITSVTTSVEKYGHIYRDSKPINDVSFNPKGTEIAFGWGEEIWVVNDDGSNKRFLTEGYNPVWSPNGKKIAFIRGGDLWTINSDGSEEKQLAKDVDSFMWSPDGKSIAFISNESLWIINSDGSRKMLISSEGDIKSFTWKDNDEIAFVSRSYIPVQLFKGVEVDIKFFDEKDELLLFENIPIEVTINLYTKNKSKLVWSGKSKISSYVETTSLGGERLKIPVEDIKKLKEARIAEVIVHTGRGDFKDEDKV